MKKQIIFVSGLIFVFSGFVFAQTKTVTNADLEKFKQKRLAAEKDLRENYAEMGFDSPEEIERQNEKSRRELLEFANQLRQDQIERENAEADRIYYQNDGYQNQDSPNYRNRNLEFVDYGRYYSAGYYNRYRTRRYKRNRGNRRFKRNRDFRQRFINGLPDYVLRNHRFNRFNNRSTQRPVRRVRKNKRK